MCGFVTRTACRKIETHLITNEQLSSWEQKHENAGTWAGGTRLDHF